MFIKEKKKTKKKTGYGDEEEICQESNDWVASKDYGNDKIIFSSESFLFLHLMLGQRKRILIE